jgi:hypothetical protein
MAREEGGRKGMIMWQANKTNGNIMRGEEGIKEIANG